MTGQVCHQVMSMNRAWFNFWSAMIMDFAVLPRHFTSAQVDYIGNVLSSFEETGREMGKLVLHAEEEAEEVLQENAEEARRTVREAREQAASTLESTINSRRQKSEGGKGRRPEQSGQEHAH
jgi:hypothetical protein